jgi:hypothetical protein
METRVEIMRVHNGFGSSNTILTGAIAIDKVLPGYFPWLYIHVRNVVN